MKFIRLVVVDDQNQLALQAGGAVPFVEIAGGDTCVLCIYDTDTDLYEPIPRTFDVPSSRIKQ